MLRIEIGAVVLSATGLPSSPVTVAVAASALAGRQRGHEDGERKDLTE